MVLLIVSVVVLTGLVVAFVLGRDHLSVHMPPATSSMGGGLPPGPVNMASLTQIRFDVVARGYRMDQVDEVIQRLSSELATREDTIAALLAGGEGARPDLTDEPDTDGTLPLR